MVLVVPLIFCLLMNLIIPLLVVNSNYGWLCLRLISVILNAVYHLLYCTVPLFNRDKEKELELSVAAQSALETPIPPAPVEPTPSVPEPVAVPEPPKPEPASTETTPAAVEQLAKPEATPPVSSGVPVVQSLQSAVAAAPKSDERKEIEELMSEGLSEVYQAMTPEQQAKFRAKGEEVATKIEVMMKTFSATAKKVVDLVREWLKLIPGVNKYFLEQESKLKTDHIIKMQRRKKKERRQSSLGID